MENINNQSLVEEIVQGKDTKINPKFSVITTGDMANAFDEVNEKSQLQLQLDSVESDMNKSLQAEKTALKISGEIFGSLGNFSLITGKAKSRKSFFLSMIAGALLSCDTNATITGHLPNDKKKVLYFDTEQGEYHVQKLHKRIGAIAGENFDNLKVYRFRGFEPTKRLELIDYAIKTTENLGYVFIDGIRDLTYSINDEQQATLLSTYLLQWTEEYNIHITTVLHQNKGDTNARGHLGTELVNKAQTVLSISRAKDNKDISLIEVTESRDKDFDGLAFEIDSDGLPYITDYTPSTSSRERSSSPTIDDLKITDILNTLFSKNKEIGYSNLWTDIKVALKEKYKISIGNNDAKELVSKLKLEGRIIQSQPRKPYTLNTNFFHKV
ncbi:AAA family ATPase [Amniculibacterium aquaticum]|uniref:AAA family ATPase n=1 Tax=Amniculibacterium aquaticum TaxID=2479858 RepID=UPI000F5A0317|nr:AAA family ATPase [Amniculibacterium aquaticum]